METIAYFVIIIMVAFLGTVRLMVTVFKSEIEKLEYWLMCFIGLLLICFISCFIFKVMGV